MKKISKSHMEAIIPATIEWQGQVPFSQHYEDIYFSKDDGVAETEYVFLKQNHLPQAWLNKEHFCIIETGFGTGLNFFCTLESWFKTADNGASLTYISVEKYPLSKADFIKQQKVWPQFSDYIEQVYNNYPPLLSGFHSCDLYDGRVKLILLFGDATEQLSTLMASADVCFLDGFAPSKNSSMWTNKLFEQLARLIKPGGTVSTFTAVGDVRRGLQEAGFEMKKVEAFGKKRHMLTGKLRQSSSLKLLYPWFQYPKSPLPKKHVTVIGAGIVGLTTAITLFQEGCDVTLVEKTASVATGASGNLAGVVMPRLDKQQSSDTHFYWQAFYSALGKLIQFEKDGVDSGWRQIGVLQIVDNLAAYIADWPSNLLTVVKKNKTKELAGVETSRDSLLINSAGFIEPEKFCRNLYVKYQDKIKFILNTEVTGLQKLTSGWEVISKNTTLTSEAIIICNAEAASQFEQTQSLPIQAVRGQVSYLKSEQAAQTKLVICNKGYAIPVNNRQILIGATFNRDNNSTVVEADDHDYNLSQYNQSLKGCSESNMSDIEGGRASIRAMTPDRLPLVGPVPDCSFYHEEYSDIKKGKKASCYQPARYHDGLYINAGHGSRGLTSSFLSADIITALILNRPIPVKADILARVHPARFLIRKLQSKI